MDTNTKILIGAAVTAGVGLILWAASSKTSAAPAPSPAPTPTPRPTSTKPTPQPSSGVLGWEMVPIDLDGPTILSPGMYGLSDDMRGGLPDIGDVQNNVFKDKGEVVYLGPTPPDRWPIDDRAEGRGYMVFRITKPFSIEDFGPAITWRLYRLVEQQPVATRPYSTPGVDA